MGTKQRDADTIGGLTLMGARLYNPTTGRFLSRDPIAGGNDNTYTYPADPINQFDLSGLTKWFYTKVMNKAKALKWARRIKYGADLADTISDSLKYVARMPSYGTIARYAAAFAASYARRIAADVFRAAAISKRGVIVRIGVSSGG